MSDDLIVELRAEADLCDQAWDAISGFHPADPDMLRIAADKIEQLERELRNAKRTLSAVLDTSPWADQSTLTVDETSQAGTGQVIFSAKATTDE